MRRSLSRFSSCAAVVAACLLCSCGDEKPAAGKAGAEAAVVTVDWSKVKAPKDGSHIVAYKKLARHLDVWYRGEQPTVRIVFNSGAVDSKGNRMAMTDREWKGMIEDTKDPKLGGSKLLIQASPHHDAPEGDAGGQIWEVTVIDAGTIDAKWLRAGR